MSATMKKAMNSFSIQATPNENALIYMFDAPIIASDQSFFFEKRLVNQNEYPKSVLQFLLSEGIESILVTKKSIVVNKSENANWKRIKAAVNKIISRLVGDAEKANTISLFEDVDAKSYEHNNQHRNELEKAIIQLIDDKIKPFVEEDGGYIEFKRFEDGIVYVKMSGACSGCPYSQITLKGGIENTLKYHFNEVISVNVEEDELGSEVEELEDDF